MNKVLLVLGASSDVGIQLIRQVSDDYDIVLAQYCNSMNNLKIIRDELGDKLILLQADFSCSDSIRGMIDDINKLDIAPTHIVHFSAPKCHNVKFIKSGIEEFNMDYKVSVESLVIVLQAFMPKMVKNKYGKIIIMLSSYTKNNPPKYLSPYITTKYALLGLVKALSVEYADKGITVNGVSPEMIETKFLSDIPDIVIQQNAANSPIGRNLMVSDVIPTFIFLLSEGSDFITGQNISITAGN